MIKIVMMKNEDLDYNNDDDDDLDFGNDIEIDEYLPYTCVDAARVMMCSTLTHLLSQLIGDRRRREEVKQFCDKTRVTTQHYSQL